MVLSAKQRVLLLARNQSNVSCHGIDKKDPTQQLLLQYTTRFIQNVCEISTRSCLFFKVKGIRNIHFEIIYLEMSE
jgi:hypothetical protein